MGKLELFKLGVNVAVGLSASKVAKTVIANSLEAGPNSVPTATQWIGAGAIGFAVADAASDAVESRIDKVVYVWKKFKVQPGE